MSKIISFLSPVYNSSEWLIKLLDSIPKEYAYEIILCDDCSTDNTVEIIKNYDFPINLLRNDKNMGCSYSYNRLVEEASGEYIAIIDSDDYYLPDFKKVCKLVDGTHDMYLYDMICKDGQIFESLENGVRWGGCFKIIKRDFIKDARFGKEGRGDVDFTENLSSRNPKCLFTHIKAYWYNYPREDSVHSRVLRGEYD